MFTTNNYLQKNLKISRIWYENSMSKFRVNVVEKIKYTFIKKFVNNFFARSRKTIERIKSFSINIWSRIRENKIFNKISSIFNKKNLWQKQKRKFMTKNEKKKYVLVIASSFILIKFLKFLKFFSIFFVIFFLSISFFFSFIFVIFIVIYLYNQIIYKIINLRRESNKLILK